MTAAIPFSFNLERKEAGEILGRAQHERRKWMKNSGTLRRPVLRCARAAVEKTFMRTRTSVSGRHTVA